MLKQKPAATLMRSLVAAVLLMSSGAFIPVWSAPTEEEIRQDIKDFQKFFKKRFPSVSLTSYQDGVNTLPQYAHRRRNWELLMSFPPYEKDMDQALAEWERPFSNGNRFESCFTGKPSGNQYPYFNGSKVQTIVGEINDCLIVNQQPLLDLDGGKMARLVAIFKSRANEKAMDIDYRNEAMRTVYEKGRKFFWARRGQLNYSCASCHVHNAGNQLRGDVLGPALGQTTGFPVYRTKWALEEKPWGTVHRQYSACMAQMGAVPFAPQSEEYIGLEVYQAVMNTGIPLKAPSQRQ